MVLGPPRPPAGRSPRKQNGFEVFALAEIGSPESNANNPEYLFLNEHHQLVFFILRFIILLDAIS